MAPDQREPAASEPITINLGFNQLIQRVDRNVTQEIIVTTADKARLCLIEALDRMERRKAWIAPAGILATLAVVFPTTTFQDFLGLSREYWRAVFSIAAVGALAWFVICLLRLQNSLTVVQIVDRLRTGSLAPAPLRPQPVKELIVTKASYGVGNNRIDVTDQLNRAIVGNNLHAHVGNQLGGDPCPNVVKNLELSYRYRNEERLVTLQEGTDLDLP